MAKIEKIEYVGRNETMDLEIDSEDHIFYANEIPTSNSHAVSYAYMAYWSAFLKANRPLDFYLNWLINAKEKQDANRETYELVESAKLDNITIKIPSIDYLEETYSIQNGAIYFGVTNVKNVGANEFRKMDRLIKEQGLEVKKNWILLLIRVLSKVNKRSVNNLISVGMFSKYKKSRTEMLHEYSCIKELTAKELEKLTDTHDPGLSLKQNLLGINELKKNGGAVSSEKRLVLFRGIIDRLEVPGFNLKDTPLTICLAEENLLGVPITYSKTDACRDATSANTRCKDISDGKRGKSILAVEIVKYNEHKTKSKTLMAFLTVRDESMELENVVVFPDIYEEFGDIIYEAATVLLFGEKAKDRDSFIVSEIIQI
tara:strand:+ start:1166 stop:2281 length:1116 start_codon:yes stop_codon:yes gene_type:complete